MIVFELFSEDDSRHEGFWAIFTTCKIYPNSQSEAFMIARSDKILVGACCITAQRWHLTFDVAVLPSFRGQGIGGTLAQEALDYLGSLVEEGTFGVGAWEVEVTHPRLYSLMERNGFTYSEKAGRRYYYKEIARR